MFVKRLARLFAKSPSSFEGLRDVKGKRLEEAELTDGLRSFKLDDWKYDKSGNRITKRVSTKDFQNNTQEFLQSVNGVAQKFGLKPDFVTGYEYVEVSLNSPDLKGVSQKDLGLASAINKLEQSHRTYCREGKSKDGYRCELRPEDEQEIYNAVAGQTGGQDRAYQQDKNQGYGVNQGFDANPRQAGNQSYGTHVGQGSGQAQNKNDDFHGGSQTYGSQHADKYQGDSASRTANADKGYGNSSGYAKAEQGGQQGGAHKGGQQTSQQGGAQQYRGSSYGDRTSGSAGSGAQKAEADGYDFHKEGADSAYKSGQESKYAKGSHTDQGVREKDRVGTKYPDSQKDQAYQESDRLKAQGAEAKKKDDGSNKIKNNNDSNEYPSSRLEPKDSTKPEDRGLKRPSPYSDDHTQRVQDGKDGSQNNYGKGKADREKSQYLNNQDKHKNINEKSYK